MDVEQLYQVLQQSFSPDANVRNPATETIKNLKSLPGATLMLLHVVAEKQVQYEVRQAAAIQLKNICREGWVARTSYNPYPNYNINNINNNVTTTNSNNNNESPAAPQQQAPPPPPVVESALITDEDKENVKNGLIQTLLGETEKSIRDLLAETLQTCVIHDFPDRWPHLVPHLLTVIRTDTNELRIHNALLAVRKIAKRYEYKSKEQRGPLNELVQDAFPLLLPLAERLVKCQTLESAMMLKQILKIFWSSTQFFLPTTHNLQPWFDVITTALQKPLPEASTGLEPLGQPTDVTERTAWPWWKLKKWSVQIMSRLFSRYGIPSFAEDDITREFAVYFSTTVAPQFLSPVCETLNLRPRGQFCTDRVVHLSLGFVSLAIELSSTYKLLKPHLDFLLYQVCFPTLCLGESDIECFENDPVEFVHKQNSPLADFYDPRIAAIQLITDLVKHRGQDVTQSLLTRMSDILQRYDSAGSVETQNHVEKDGALLTFGSLAKYILKKEKYANEIEGLLINSVFPDFTSPVAFLRYRACWMVQQFSDVRFGDANHLRTLIQMVLQRLSDPSLPVQIEASKALRYLIEREGAESTLLPVLPQLLTEYFRIMNEIGNDEVVSALQALLDKFGDHIEPHAVALVTQLSNAFAQYCTAGEDEDDDDAALAAAQCLECISTVLKGVCTNADMLRSLEPLLVPLVLKILGNDGEFIEYLECALDILTFLTYFQERLSAEVWQAFPLIYIAYDQWAYDYINMMVPCLQSYITKGPDVFLQGVAMLPEGSIPYITLISTMVAKTLSNDRASESECRYALSLVMSILHNCPGQVDGFLPFINDIVLGKLGQQVNTEIPTTRISIYQVLGSALYYNPQLQIIELESKGVTQQVFLKWFEDIEKVDRYLPQKLTVLGFTAMFTIPAAAMPPSIVGILPQILHVAVRTTIKLKEDVEKGQTPSNTDFDEEIHPDFGGDVDGGFNEDEDVKNDVDEAYKKALTGITNFDDDMAHFLLGDWDDDGEDPDEDYSSPIDPIDEMTFLGDLLRRAFEREPESYQQVQAALPTETVASLQRIVAHAESVRAQAAQQGSQQS